MRAARILSAVLAAAVAGAPASAAGPGSVTANVLKAGTGGRASGMGEAQVAAAQDVFALYWNPAGLGQLRQPEAAFMHSDLFLGQKQDLLTGAFPSAKGVWAAGYLASGVDGVPSYDRSGSPTGDLGVSDQLLTLAWAGSWGAREGNFSAQSGVGVKFLRKRLGGDAASGTLADAGVQGEWTGTFLRGLRLGGVLENMGPDVKFVDESAPLPSRLKLGMSYPLFGESLVMAMDWVNPRDDRAFVNAGMEYRLNDVVAFRLGRKGRRDAQGGLSYGVGLGGQRLRLDYAFVPAGDLGNVQRLSVTFRFGKARGEVQVADQVGRAYAKAETRYAQGYLVEAYMQASQIVALAPWHAPSRRLMRRIEADFRQLEDQTVKQQLQDQIDEHFSRGERAYQQDDLMAARREFEAVHALRPESAGAMTYLHRIEERYRSIAQTFYDAALKAIASGDLKGARDFLGKVLVVDPDNLPARQHLAGVEASLREIEDTAASRARADAVRSLDAAGVDFFKAGKYEDALVKFQDALDVDGKDPEAGHYAPLCRDRAAKGALDQAGAAARDGDWVRAGELFQKAARIKPGSGEARKGLAEASRELYRKGLKSFLAGRRDAALEAWRKALELDPGNLEARRGVERLAATGGQELPAAPAAAPAAEPPGAPSPAPPSGPSKARREEAENLYRRGLELLSEGQQEKASELWRKALELDPDNADVKQGMEMLSPR